MNSAGGSPFRLRTWAGHRPEWGRLALGFFLLTARLLNAGEPAEPTRVAAPLYEYSRPSPDGIGKWYLGREIAHVMGHQGADWLERPEREHEEAPDQVIAELELTAGAVVADVGAGTGYFTWRLARAVGPEGRVYAVDIQPEMLERLEARMRTQGVSNVVRVLGAERDPRLPPGQLDLVLLVDVYHEFAWPHEMLEAICRALKPGGRVAFVEYRAEDPSVPIKPLHKMTETQIRREAARHPLEWVRTDHRLPRQHLVIFRKTAGGAGQPAATPHGEVTSQTPRSGSPAPRSRGSGPGRADRTRFCGRCCAPGRGRRRR